MRWAPEETAVLREHYAGNGVGFVARLLNRTDKQVMKKAYSLGLRVVSTTRNGKPLICKPKGSPQISVAPSKRGPAYSDAPMVFTDQTRRVVCPSLPAHFRSNTYSVY